MTSHDTLVLAVAGCLDKIVELGEQVLAASKQIESLTTELETQHTQLNALGLAKYVRGYFYRTVGGQTYSTLLNGYPTMDHRGLQELMDEGYMPIDLQLAYEIGWPTV